MRPLDSGTLRWGSNPPLPRSRHAVFRPLRPLAACGIGRASCCPTSASSSQLVSFKLSISRRVVVWSHHEDSKGRVGPPRLAPVVCGGVAVECIHSVTRASEPGVLWAFDRPAARLSRANRRRRNHPSSLKIFDGDTRVTSASPWRLDNFWEVHRYETLGLLLAEQDNRAYRQAAATLRELACPKVTAILPAWLVSGLIFWLT